MGIRRTTIGDDIVVLQVAGEFFGGDETDRLQEAIAKEEAVGNMKLILDLSNCSQMNSTALSVLVMAHKGYTARGAHIKLCGLQKKMTSLLVMTRLINVFGHYPTVEEAAASFVLGSTATS